MIWIGTSGFQYPEWRGTFYPEKLSAAKMLGYYAAHFRTTEVNYTFHRMPSAKTALGWFAGTPDHFRFALKAPQQITHVRRLKDCTSAVRYFGEVTAGLGQKRGPVLFQLPPFLKRDDARLADFLAQLEAIGAEAPRLDVPAGATPALAAAFEFRDASWFDDAIFAILRQHGAALCIADSEDRHTPVEFTADFGYLRLRSPRYGPAEMDHWAEVIRRRAAQVREVFVFFKHEEAGTGPVFARELMQRMAEEQAAA